MTAPTDDELVALYRAGQESAATELVRRHAGPIGRYLYGRGAGSSDIDDLVQETFFRAFRALAEWRGQASFRGWLFRIAGNHHRDQFRRARGRTLVPLGPDDAQDAADPEGEVGASEMEAVLVAELNRLPRLQREVFLLRAQQGLDYAEISAALGTTAGAARVHYHHAVKRLKEKLR